MFKTTLRILSLAALLWVAPPVTSVLLGSTAGSVQAQSATFNWFDPSAWMAQPGAAGGQGVAGMPGTLRFNLAQPGGWSVFMRPSTYPALMNPATYAQFMTPQFYMQFANPANWMSWMNPAAYAQWMNPGTYMQWMNPAEYMAMMNPASYMQWMNPGNYAAFMNPGTYMQWMNPAAYAFPTSTAGAVPNFNWFDPNAWARMGQPVQPGVGAGPGPIPFNPYDPSNWAVQPQGVAPQGEGQPRKP